MCLPPCLSYHHHSNQPTNHPTTHPPTHPTPPVGACPASIYVGARDAQKRRHGQGAGVLGNGDIYKGEWKQDRPQGKGALVSIAHRDVFEGEVLPAPPDEEDEGLTWGGGRWCLLSGWRVEAARFLRPRVPHDFVTVFTPSAPTHAHGGGSSGGRTRVEAMYRVVKHGAGAKREDADVRITLGGGQGGYRGSVWPWEKERDGGDGPLVSVPRPRMGLEWRAEEAGGGGGGGSLMREAEFGEDGAVTSTRMSVRRTPDGAPEYGGEVMAIMSNAPKVRCCGVGGWVPTCHCHCHSSYVQTLVSHNVCVRRMAGVPRLPREAGHPARGEGVAAQDPRALLRGRPATAAAARGRAGGGGARHGAAAGVCTAGRGGGGGTAAAAAAAAGGGDSRRQAQGDGGRAAADRRGAPGGQRAHHGGQSGSVGFGGLFLLLYPFD